MPYINIVNILCKLSLNTKHLYVDIFDLLFQIIINMLALCIFLLTNIKLSINCKSIKKT